MKHPKEFSRDRAANELTNLLGQVSAIKLENIRDEQPVPGSEGGILVQIRVLGHRHTLICRVMSSDEPRPVRAALQKLRNQIANHAGDVTPVIIATNLSPEAQKLCVQSDAGFLDLEGNARLVVNDVFIAKRSLGCRDYRPVSSVRVCEPARFDNQAA
jgi:hypothetical protein